MPNNFKRSQLKNILMSLPHDGCILLFGVSGQQSIRSSFSVYGVSGHRLYDPFDRIVERDTADYYVTESSDT